MPRPEYPAPAFTENAARALFDGDAYREMVAMVGRAERSVRLEMFLFGGPVADAMIEVLADKRRQGVCVAVTLDRALGMLPLVRRECRAAYRRLRAEGFDVLLSDSRPLPGAGRRPAVAHSKILVVDEREALVGGMNVGTPFFRHHDVMIHLEGPAAASLARQFDHDRHFLQDAAAERPTETCVLPGGEPPHGGDLCHVRLLGTGLGRRTTREAVTWNMRTARTSVSVAMSEIGRTAVLGELIAAHRRGVDVHVLVDPQNLREYLPPFLGSLRDRWPQGALNALAVQELLAAGVPVRSFAVGGDFAMLHQKTAILDGEAAIVGSTNWTRGGFEWIGETDVELRGGTVVAQLAEQFARDWEAAAPATVPPWHVRATCRAYERWTQ